MKVRVAFVDDHVLFVEGCKKLVEEEFEVVATYNDPRAFLLDLPNLKVDVVLLDVSMPQLNGLDAAREILRIEPKTRVIILTMNEDPDIAAEAFRIGAAGYLLKRSAGAELMLAIREVMNQRYYVTPLLTKELVGSLVQDSQARKPLYQLTSRQRDVLQLLAEGRSMKQAAAVLHVSARTVAFHKYRMMEHLNVHSTAELIQFAVREGLV
jgi:DNA-binding NarL/FixJ family response regulator